MEPAEPTNADARAGGPRLLRHAVRRLLDASAAGTPFGTGPLVVVAPNGAAWLDDLARGAATASFDGRALGRELVAALEEDTWPRLRRRLSRPGLAIVRNLEGLGSGPAQELFATLLEAGAETGTNWCCSLTRHPAAAGFIPMLASRLVAGLVVFGPTAVAVDREPAGAARPTVADVIAATARHFGISPGALTGDRRGRSLVRARSLAMYLARHLGGASFAAIGRGCGGRDHTTALHGVRVTTARLGADSGLAADAARIAALLRGKDRRPSRRRRAV